MLVERQRPGERGAAPVRPAAAAVLRSVSVSPAGSTAQRQAGCAMPWPRRRRAWPRQGRVLLRESGTEPVVPRHGRRGRMRGLVSRGLSTSLCADDHADHPGPGARVIPRILAIAGSDFGRGAPGSRADIKDGDGVWGGLCQHGHHCVDGAGYARCPMPFMPCRKTSYAARSRWALGRSRRRCDQGPACWVDADTVGTVAPGPWPVAGLPLVIDPVMVGQGRRSLAGA